MASALAHLGTLSRVVVALGLVAAACGGSGSDQAGTTPTTTDETITVPSTPSSSAETPSSTEPPSPSTSDTGPSTTTAPQVLVFFSTGDGADCGYVTAHPRTVAVGDDPIEAAFLALVGGPNDEEVVEGAWSFFSAATADIVQSVDLDGGLLIVDLEDARAELANASTSCGSEALLAQLTATAFQFPDVDQVRFEIEGDCDTFWNWLQRECNVVERNDVPTTSAVADGSGCSPGTDVLITGRWFGFLEEVTENDLDFDLACWFSGDAAIVAAREDGAESPPPNDYHVRNESQVLRRVPVAETATVRWLPNPGDPSTETVSTYATWLAERPLRSFQPGVWITIDDSGNIVELFEQYTP